MKNSSESPKAPRRPKKPEIFHRTTIMVLDSDNHKGLTLYGGPRTLAEVIDCIPEDIPFEEVLCGVHQWEGSEDYQIWFHRYELKENAEVLLAQYKIDHAEWEVKMEKHRKESAAWWEEKMDKDKKEKSLKMRLDLVELEAKAKSIRDQIHEDTKGIRFPNMERK